MKTEHNLAKMQSRKNPYTTRLTKPVTIRLSEDLIIYFKQMTEEADVPYQCLINLYLRDCVAKHRKIDMSWESSRQPLSSFTPELWCEADINKFNQIE